jgi:hypothetical protein
VHYAKPHLETQGLLPLPTTALVPSAIAKPFFGDALLIDDSPLIEDFHNIYSIIDLALQCTQLNSLPSRSGQPISIDITASQIRACYQPCSN